MGESEVNKEAMLEEFKMWVENEAEFYGRTDEEFLTMFLRPNNFDVEDSKEALTRYYALRRDVPEWWGNHRNAKDEKTNALLQHKIITALIENRQQEMPTIFFSIVGRINNNSSDMDNYLLVCSIYVDVIIRRQNSQIHGGYWIIDFKDYKWWLIFKCFSLPTAKKFVNSFLWSMPSKRQLKIVVLNTPTIASTAFNLCKSLFPEALRNKIYLCGSDWSASVSRILPIEWLPDEYGGKAGPMKMHDDAFVQEIMEYNDYLLEDNQYGFKN